MLNKKTSYTDLSSKVFDWCEIDSKKYLITVSLKFMFLDVWNVRHITIL